MQLGTVSGVVCRRDTTLGVIARRAGQRPLRDYENLGALFDCGQRSEETGDTGSDYQEIGSIALRLGNLASHFLAGPLSYRLIVENLAASLPGSRLEEQNVASRHPAHVTLAVVLQVRDGSLKTLLWQRAREPYLGASALPGGYLEPGETLEDSIRRHLAQKVDVRELSHIEQLVTSSEPDQHSSREWQVATAFLGLIPSGLDPAIPADTSWHCVDALPSTAFDHGPITLTGKQRLQGKLSYTNIGFALAPETFTISELRDLYTVALGHEVSATNLQRVLLRRELLEPTGERRDSGPFGGRPAALYRFRSRTLSITDQFAVLRPPGKHN